MLKEENTIIEEESTKKLYDLNFFLVLCKTKKKLDKYIKINRIRKKDIIDIKKMLDEEDLTYEESLTSDLFKIQIIKKFNTAIEKNKDIYYVPYFDNKNTDVLKNLKIKNIFKDTHNFNLLYFYEDFVNKDKTSLILNHVEEFDLIQILKDY